MCTREAVLEMVMCLMLSLFHLSSRILKMQFLLSELSWTAVAETLVSGSMEQRYWLIKVLCFESCSSKEGETAVMNSYLHCELVQSLSLFLKKRCDCSWCHHYVAESWKMRSWSQKETKQASWTKLCLANWRDLGVNKVLDFGSFFPDFVSLLFFIILANSSTHW